MPRNLGQWISLALLCAALALFVGFQVQPSFDESQRGFEVWPDLWDTLREPETLKDPADLIVIFCFLGFSLLILTAPFLGTVWRKSGFAWLSALITSGLATAGFWGVILSDFPEQLGPGGACLMLAPLLNFCGLVLARSGESTGGSTAKSHSNAAGKPPAAD